MKVEDNLYINHGDVVMNVKITAWRRISEGDSGPEGPKDTSYPEEATEFAEALEDVREALAELDEADGGPPEA